MSTRFVFAAPVFAALLGACSSPPSDIRPEVAQPLNEARVLANGWSDKAAVMAKLNQAAAVPNLNQDEQDKIHATAIYALARNGYRSIPGSQSGAPQREMMPQSSVNTGRQ